jgi:hypothetical protein
VSGAPHVSGLIQAATLSGALQGTTPYSLGTPERQFDGGRPDQGRGATLTGLLQGATATPRACRARAQSFSSPATLTVTELATVRRLYAEDMLMRNMRSAPLSTMDDQVNLVHLVTWLFDGRSTRQVCMCAAYLTTGATSGCSTCVFDVDRNDLLGSLSFNHPTFRSRVLRRSQHPVSRTNQHHVSDGSYM